MRLRKQFILLLAVRVEAEVEYFTIGVFGFCEMALCIDFIVNPFRWSNVDLLTASVIRRL